MTAGTPNTAAATARTPNPGRERTAARKRWARRSSPVGRIAIAVSPQRIRVRHLDARGRARRAGGVLEVGRTRGIDPRCLRVGSRFYQWIDGDDGQLTDDRRCSRIAGRGERHRGAGVGEDHGRALGLDRTAHRKQRHRNASGVQAGQERHGVGGSVRAHDGYPVPWRTDVEQGLRVSEGGVVKYGIGRCCGKAFGPPIGQGDDSVRVRPVEGMCPHALVQQIGRRRHEG